MKRDRRIDEMPQHRNDALTTAITRARQTGKNFVPFNKRKAMGAPVSRDPVFFGLHHSKRKVTLPKLDWPKSDE